MLLVNIVENQENQAAHEFQNAYTKSAVILEKNPEKSVAIAENPEKSVVILENADTKRVAILEKDVVIRGNQEVKEVFPKASQSRQWMITKIF